MARAERQPIPFSVFAVAVCNMNIRSFYFLKDCTEFVFNWNIFYLVVEALWFRLFTITREKDIMDWQRAADPETGKAYYYCTTTQASQWDFPEPVLVTTLAKHGYAKAITDEGLMYFYKEESGESVWDLPAPVLDELRETFGLDLTENEIKGVAATDTETTTTTVATTTIAETSTQTEKDSTSQEKKQEVIAANKEVMKEEMEIDADLVASRSTNPINHLLGVGTTLLKEEVSKEGADMVTESEPLTASDGYMQLLGSLDIDAESKFTDIMPKLISDERYWRLGDPIKRERLFNEHIESLKVAEVNASKDKHRNDFLKLFQRQKVKHYTRWATFLGNISGEDKRLFDSVPSDISKEFFDEHIAELKEAKELTSKELRDSEMKELNVELQGLVDVNTQFLGVLPSLQIKYKMLSKEDILDAFERRIIEAEDAFEGVIEENRELNYREDKIARSRFKAMLKCALDDGSLKMNSKTKWFQFVQTLKDKPEFVELCGHHGSSAIDYYWDLLDERNCQLSSKFQIFRQQLINANKKIEYLSCEEFLSIIQRCNRMEIANMDKEDITTVYEMMRAESGVPNYSSNAMKRPAEEPGAGAIHGKRAKISLRRPN